MIWQTNKYNEKHTNIQIAPSTTTCLMYESSKKEIFKDLLVFSMKGYMLNRAGGKFIGPPCKGPKYTLFLEGRGCHTPNT